MVEPYTTFKGVTSIGDTLLMNELENNMKTFIDWAMLGIGGFTNVVIPASSSFGGNFHTLKLAPDPTYTTGRVWEAIKKDWVWETGVNYNGVSPIAISGVWINGQFFAPGHATWGHYYDYRNGRVIFNNPLPSSSGVTLNYSYRTVQVYVSKNADWFFQGQYESYKPTNPQWATSYSNGSGDWANPPSHRVQFPAIIIEAVPRGVGRPYELGNSALWIDQDVKYNIVSENKWFRNQLLDILRFEQGRTLWLYDSDRVARSGYNALDYRNMLVNTTGIYPYLVDNFRFERAFIKNAVMSEVASLNPNLYEGVVRTTFEVSVGRM